MIQDITPCKLDNSFIPGKKPDVDAYVAIRRQNMLLLRDTDGTIALPRVQELPDSDTAYTYLFSISGQDFYMPDSMDDSGIEQLLQNGYSFQKAMTLRGLRPKWLIFGAITAFQLCGWYRDNRFCGRCGKPLRQHTEERSLLCEDCGNLLYPKICPAVIVAVMDGDRLLMAKYADQRDGTRYALIAGFTEIGETIEQTVAREVREETGLAVKNIRYYKSQPWSFSDSLLLGFFCEVDGPTEITIDDRELSVAEWVPRKEMQIKNSGISLTYEMMEKFQRNEMSDVAREMPAMQPEDGMRFSGRM